jgi:ribonuclease HI
MGKKKVYAVRKGKKEGIFETWEECKAAVNGYSCAEYKSFSTYEEALAYMDREGAAVLAGTQGQEENQILAYVDGSFDVRLGKYSFGCIIILPDGEIIRKSGNGDDPESVALRNVTGEMLGAMSAVTWCIENGYSSVKICYDYSGIEMWATGLWKTNKDLTKKYAAFMKENAKNIAITFQKIEAHTGNKYNEEADQLAKAALTAGADVLVINQENIRHISKKGE